MALPLSYIFLQTGKGSDDARIAGTAAREMVVPTPAKMPVDRVKIAFSSSTIFILEDYLQ